MDISKLSDQEKSVMLARAMGWRILDTGLRWEVVESNKDNYARMEGRPAPLIIETPEGIRLTDLFATDEDGLPIYMPLAWRVLNWAMHHDGPWGFAISCGDFELEAFLYECVLWNKSPKKAQRAWLDKILELTIEAGLVELEQVS